MKLLTFKHNDNVYLGAVCECVKTVVKLSDVGLNFNSMQTLIQNIMDSELELIRTATKTCEIFKRIPLSEIELLAPIRYPARDIICLGLNYADHIEEAARFNSKKFGINMPKAVYFSKRVNESVAPFGKIPSHPKLCDSLDYEAELALVISKNARNVAAKDALEYIFGYTIINDVSARNVQTEHKQWYFGKSLDGFCPMGPYLVTSDEIGVYPKLKIQSYVNGELRQNSNTDNMIYKIPQIIEELSSGMTLQAGTIIALGTPSGVGLGFNPPKFLKSGDTVVCKIENIGEISNTVE